MYADLESPAPLPIRATGRYYTSSRVDSSSELMQAAMLANAVQTHGTELLQEDGASAASHWTTVARKDEVKKWTRKKRSFQICGKQNR